jgi:copper(I)-binding protein
VGSLTRRAVAVALSLVALFPLAGCGGGSTAERAPAVSRAWARVSAPGQTTGAVYFELETGDDDVLLAVTVPASVADHAEIHEELADEQGRMTMRELTDGLELAGGETTRFEPGGLHVMLVDLAAPLVDGAGFDVTFEFERADPVTVAVRVAASAP